MSIKAMRQALEAMRDAAYDEEGYTLNPDLAEAHDNLRSAIEHYDQTALELCEECGWKAIIPGDGCLVCARQKPVAWMYDFLNSANRDEVIRDWMTQDYADITLENGFNVRPLFSVPREWVGLTRNEAMEIINSLVGHDWRYAVDAIEAKLKDKNNG